ncbi:TolC family protein [Pseudomonas tolaasii]|uniref:TolC family protein n=1 Tax=Pseudomonas tolaasii TaxID=29442 RepID=UPI001C52BCFB|nr:TolC family protein [Pseudomonas tolaasii]QXQ20670.1 TolC family protein [Pseudomonas tolaasii]
MNNSFLKSGKVCLMSVALACAYANSSSTVLAQEPKQSLLNDRQVAGLMQRFSSAPSPVEPPTPVPVASPVPEVSEVPVRALQSVNAVTSVTPPSVAKEPLAPVLPAPSLLNSIEAGRGRPVSSELRSLMRDMVIKALQHSPELQVARSNESAADYEIDEIKGRRWPQVRVGMNSALTKDDNRASGSGRIAGTLNVTTNVWDWGKNKSDTYAAKASLALAEQTTQSEREQVAFNTTSELVSLIRANRSAVIAEEYVRQMNDRVEMLSKITHNDKGRASELVQAQARLLSAEASREQIKNQQKISQIKLYRLLGEDAPVLSETLLVVGRPMITAEAALASLDLHPILLRLKSKAEVEEGRERALKAQGLPGLNLVVRKEQDDSGSQSRRQNDWYAGLDVQWDLFSGGSNTAARKAAGARKLSALEEYQKTDQDLRQEILRLVQSRANAVQLATEYQQLSLETDRVRKMFYDQWYHLGKRTLLDVLVAENEHFNSQLQTISNISDSLIADLSILSSSAQLLSFLSLN